MLITGPRDNLNPSVTEDEAVEMLAQHVLTRPVFDALFEGYSFIQENPVSKAMQAVVERLDESQVGRETDDMEKFYEIIRERARLAKSDKSRQDNYLSREEKLALIDDFGDIGRVPWQRIVPNASGDWLNLRDPAFDRFLALGNKEDSITHCIFGTYSLGVVTNRNAWTYNSSRTALSTNMRRLIDAYNGEAQRYAASFSGIPKEQRPALETMIDSDPKRISWTRSLKADARRGKRYSFRASDTVIGAYRPFAKQWFYFNRHFNEMVYRVPSLFPTPNHPNVVISSTGVADRKGYSALVTDHVPNMHLTDTGQCFPLYWYERVDDDVQPQPDLFDEPKIPDEHGYIRHDAVTDWALATFQERYGDEAIGKEDIFWFIYGVLHSPEYRTRFAANLKKMLPRIPFTENFWAFSGAGRELGRWHLGYETVEPWPVTESAKRLVMEDDDYLV